MPLFTGAVRVCCSTACVHFNKRVVLAGSTCYIYSELYIYQKQVILWFLQGANEFGVKSMNIKISNHQREIFPIKKQCLTFSKMLQEVQVQRWTTWLSQTFFVSLIVLSGAYLFFFYLPSNAVPSLFVYRWRRSAAVAIQPRTDKDALRIALWVRFL